MGMLYEQVGLYPDAIGRFIRSSFHSFFLMLAKITQIPLIFRLLNRCNTDFYFGEVHIF